MLTEYALAVKDRVKQIILVHGEPNASSTFQEILTRNGMSQIIYPDLFECIEI